MSRPFIASDYLGCGISRSRCALQSFAVTRHSYVLRDDPPSMKSKTVFSGQIGSDWLKSLVYFKPHIILLHLMLLIDDLLPQRKTHAEPVKVR